MFKDQQFIRQVIIKGILPIGTAFKKTIVDPKWNEEKESSQYDLICTQNPGHIDF